MPGIPGRPPGCGARPSGARGPAGPVPSGTGRAGRERPIPCDGANGLFPGRGVPGRRPPGAPGSPPVEPGRGRGAVVGCSAVRAAGAACPGARGTPGRGTAVGWGPVGWGPVGWGRVGATGGAAGADAAGAMGVAGAAGAGGAAAVGAVGAVAAGTSTGTSAAAATDGACSPSAFLAAAFLAGAFLTGGGSLASFSLRRLSTGASTVDEADRTNSPMSFSMLRTVLLSTPSSFASS
jgi:hypothetical protein